MILCSVYSWAVIIDKLRLFKKINKSSEEFEEKFWNSKSAESLFNSLPSKLEDPMALVFQNAMEGLLKRKSRNNLSERTIALLENGIEKQMSKIDNGFTFLATVGSTAPFIGLFGTVWGIMNAFGGLSQLTQVSITVVAPGISEALIATALGLFAAIPALISYNWNLNKINTFINEYSNFSEELIIILAKEIDENKRP